MFNSPAGKNTLRHIFEKENEKKKKKKKKRKKENTERSLDSIVLLERKCMHDPIPYS